MPGRMPPTSQLDWLISTTAMIVLFWSRATRDLLKSFGWGIATLHRLIQRRNCHPCRPPHSISPLEGTGFELLVRGRFPVVTGILEKVPSLQCDSRTGRLLACRELGIDGGTNLVPRARYGLLEAPAGDAVDVSLGRGCDDLVLWQPRCRHQ